MSERSNQFTRIKSALAGVCIGLGFLTKQMQVFLVLPGFALAILIASPTKFWRRLVDGVVALSSMVVSAGWWVLLTVIVPAGSRPYIGGSQNNSFLELTFGYNGFGRLTGNETGSVVPGGGVGRASAGHAGTGSTGGKITETLGNAYGAMTGAIGGGPGGAPGAGAGQGGHAGRGQGGGMWGQTGITRLFDGVYGTQISWLAPIAFAGILIGLAVSIRVRRTDMRRAGVMVWGGWLAVTWLTFSFMGGIFHQYYTVALAPAVAVMVAVAAQSLWERRDVLWSRLVATVLVLVNTLWAAQLLSRSTWLPWLRPSVLVVGGFNGSDPSPTLAQFKRYVKQGKIHYYIAGGEMGSGRMGTGDGQQDGAGAQSDSEAQDIGNGLSGNSIGGIGGNQMGGSNASSEIATWVKSNFKSQTVDGVTLYDLTGPKATK